MTYSKELQELTTQLGIADENVLYLTINKVAMDDIRSGDKTVEYRDDTDHYISKLFKKDKQGKRQLKPYTHMLLQAGYTFGSARIMVELKGVDFNGTTWPTQGSQLPQVLADAGYHVYQDCFNLLLGQVIFESENYPESKPVKHRQERKVVQKVELNVPSIAYAKPINIVEVTYQQTGQSKTTNHMGMREMQERAYAARTAQHLLIKAPPASGKSMALMFLALDKLVNQNIKKVIVAVPEKSIGGSFRTTKLSDHGFFADWEPNPIYNLCTEVNSTSKVKIFQDFMESNERILICTHATLRFAYEALKATDFDDCLVAIDEFHHVSADENNILGKVLKDLMSGSNCHIVAMTGSYFRGDSAPVLLPEDEAKFTKVTYNYYEQLNGYQHLKSLGIGYHFYRGKYFQKHGDNELSALEEILDENKKTIIHIPNVNSIESSREKHEEVGHIIDALGDLEFQDETTGLLYVKSKRSGRIIKIADLVNDNPKERDKISAYLRQVNSPEDVDMIIALGMAKEGFDWPYCEHALTVGYRGSLTEIIQIIGRATRDSHNKTHAQFTNLIASPEVEEGSDEVQVAVNNMLKAITASLLMEQVLAPNFKFKIKQEDGQLTDENEEEDDDNTIRIRGFKLPSSQRAQEIIETDLNDLKARILQDDQILKALPSNIQPEVINTILIPKVIREAHPDINAEDIEAIRQHILVDSVVKSGVIEQQGDKKFLRLASSFINIDEINIELIDSINPFQKGFEILSKKVTSKMLGVINNHIQSIKIDITEEEAKILSPQIKAWMKQTGQDPNLQSHDPKEKRLAEALVFIRELMVKQKLLNNA